MLLVFFIVVTILLIVGGIILIKCSDYDATEVLGFILGVIGIVMGLITGMLIFTAVSNHIDRDANVAKSQVRYESLVYQYENGLYDNDNDVGKKELMDDIQEWNEDLAYHQKVQDDLWLGIFYPNVYDQFKFIELK